MTSDEFSDIEQLDENLRKWFKEKWVRFGPDGKIRGACARGDDSEGKPKCLPQKKAQNLGKKGRKYAASKKRREDPNPERRGKAKNVATKKKTNENIPFNECPECRGPIVHESMMTEKQDACYHKVKSRYKVWPSAYASGALVQCRKKGASNWGTGGKKKNESSIMKGIVDESENVLVLYIDGKPSTKYAKDHEAKSDLERLKAKFPNKKFELKREMREGVIIGHDATDPDVAVLGGAGSYKLSNLKKKAQMEANELAKDVSEGKFKNSAYNVKQLANTLNTIVAAEEEMEKNYFGEDYTGEFAAEVTPTVNPHAGIKDNKFRGAISETPTDNITGSSGEGGWRKYSPKPAGTNAHENLSESEIEDRLVNLTRKYKANFGKTYRGKTVPPGIWQLLRTGTYIEQQIDNTLNHIVARGKALSNLEKDTRYYNPYLGKHSADELRAVRAKIHPEAANEIGEDTAYAGGMGQGGNAGESYRKFKPKSAGTFKEEELDEACWKGYHKEGNKKMFGKTYPNCVKNTNEEEQLDEKCWDTHKQVGMKNKGGRQVPNCVPKESAIFKGIKNRLD